ncbi:MAG TPA: hypothetical protein P5328_01925 [Candidatus Paceibacterota bacterium]|nr:hypothetical protein [Candidatus Paceibacterota bacterium]HRZ34489.1 hypothetical protein [Candidatus Paceibacterota bacterium]
MTIKTLQININRTGCVKTLSMVILGVVFSYVYMINAISFNTASREKVSDLISMRQSEISELESQFLSESKKIDLPVAKSLGLVKSMENETFVVVRQSNSRLTLNE